MAKLIQRYYGKLISAELISKSKTNDSLLWRKAFVGFVGIINIYQSQRKHKGKLYLIMCDSELNYLKTSIGEVTLNNDKLIFTTNNTKYTFKIITKGG